jgi:hypothetical protein
MISTGDAAPQLSYPLRPRPGQDFIPGGGPYVLFFKQEVRVSRCASYTKPLR